MRRKLRNEAANKLAKEAAPRRRVNDLRRPDEAAPLRERVRFLQDRVLSRPTTGRKADNAFYDELSDNA